MGLRNIIMTKQVDGAIKNIVIVGGGTAGWITAGLIAAEHKANSDSGIHLTLIESPDVNTIGVGEGTWPTMRNTLKKIGITETDLFRLCDASFKQGSKFVNWRTGQADDQYFHPFMLPHGYKQTDLVRPWQKYQAAQPFDQTVCFQGFLCDLNKAPKQITTPEYAAVANYGYHLDAAKLASLIEQHCIKKLGVHHIVDHVETIHSKACGDIESLETKNNGEIKGDLFIDCSGLASLLMGKHFGVKFIEKKSVLFNDSALAVHVPYPQEQSEIASYTISTAQSAGWIWDIGLPSRRGVGHVYSSQHQSDEKAALELSRYIENSVSKQVAESLSFRKLSFTPGHLEKFWHKNCVAVGMSAGFLEPLEASALVLVELAATSISRDLPVNRKVMDIVAKRYNDKFLYRWRRIIEFLKLHYVLSQREGEYWQDNRAIETIPETLAELLTLWQYQPPSTEDFSQVDEVFPAASWQYILSGMKFETSARATDCQQVNYEMAQQLFNENAQLAQRYASALVSNRELINKIKEFGLQKI